MDPANPLTARVAVNRYWQAYFGTGLVKTAEDFGAQGEAPSHPELLDWLATEFVRTGWDVKAMQRLIVTSATYRQASQATAGAARARSGESPAGARPARAAGRGDDSRPGARHCRTCSTIKMGGPAVKPYQPEGLWEQLSAFQGRKLFERSTGEDLWRRSVYTYWKRTVPPPSLTIFDAPTREFCVVRRQASSTPLQALALLNDEMYIETARKLAERMMKEGGATPARAPCVGVPAGDLAPADARGSRNPGARARAAGWRNIAPIVRPRGEAARGRRIAARCASSTSAELAAYTTAASVILNLDEVITRQ